MVVGANTARFQKRWLLVPATIGLCCVLFYYATDRLPASTAELQRNRKEMLALRAEMLKMQDSMARTAKPERHAAASTAELQKNRKEMLALLRAEMLKMKDSTATPNTGNIGVPETKIDVASGVADGAAPEGCVPCWIKPGLDSMDTIGEAYGRRTGHSTDKIGGGSYKWDERKGILKHGECVTLQTPELPAVMRVECHCCCQYLRRVHGSSCCPCCHVAQSLGHWCVWLADAGCGLLLQHSCCCAC